MTNGSILFSASSEVQTPFSQCVEVLATDDNLIETSESVTVTINAESLNANDAIDNGQVTVTIEDNDGMPVLECPSLKVITVL